MAVLGGCVGVDAGAPCSWRKGMRRFWFILVCSVRDKEIHSTEASTALCLTERGTRRPNWSQKVKLMIGLT